MNMGVHHLLTSDPTNIRSEIEASHIRILRADRLSAEHGKLMDDFPLGCGGFENVRNMPSGNDERVKGTNGGLVPDRKRQSVLGQNAV